MGFQRSSRCLGVKDLLSVPIAWQAMTWAFCDINLGDGAQVTAQTSEPAYLDPDTPNRQPGVSAFALGVF